MSDKQPLSSRVRKGSEAAPWVCDEITELERELAEAKETISDMETRHAAAMLHTQTVVDDANELRAQRDALLEALEELHAAMVRYDVDVDGEAPSEHHQMMSRVRSAIALAKGGGQ